MHEFDLLPDTRDHTMVWSRMTIWVCAVFTVTAITWAGLVKIDIPIEVDGITVPSLEVRKVNALSDGILAGIYVREGDIVKEGQLLANFGDLQLREKLIVLEQQRLLIEERIRQNRLGGKWQIDDLTDMQRVTEIEGQMLELQHQMTLLKLYSPLNGVIAGVFITQAGPVKSGQQICDILPEGTTYYIESFLPSKEARRVDIGTEANIRLDAWPAHKFGAITAYVSKISVMAGSADQSETRFRLEISLKETVSDLFHRNILLKPGLQGKVLLRTESKSILALLFDSLRK
jgi:hypothetical protein